MMSRGDPAVMSPAANAAPLVSRIDFTPRLLTLIVDAPVLVFSARKVTRRPST